MRRGQGEKEAVGAVVESRARRTGRTRAGRAEEEQDSVDDEVMLRDYAIWYIR